MFIGKKATQDSPLQYKIDEGVLAIYIGVRTLGWAFEHSDGNNPLKTVGQDEDGPVQDWVRKYKVVNNEEFAKDVVRELFREKEDGSNPINVLLDKMCDEAVNQGSIAVEEFNKPVEDKSDA